MKVKKDKTANKKPRDQINRQLEWKFQNEGAEADVKNKIKEAFRQNGEIDADRIMVNVHDGTVELWGRVRTWAGIHEAERISLGIPGVSRVDAHLRIGR